MQYGCVLLRGIMDIQCVVALQGDQRNSLHCAGLKGQTRMKAKAERPSG